MPAADTYAGLEPRELWLHFGALNEIPRPSRSEAAARDYVLRLARAAGAPAHTDAKGNTVVHVPATPGRAPAPVIAIQAHLDMVCEKRPETEHDFQRDPIRPRLDGDWVYGTGTTLGADNGIGAAAALALLTGAGAPHGPLDLIFTVEEEIGLQGATALDASPIRARALINLDSENPREITIGCAGGAGAELLLPLAYAKTPAGWRGARVVVSGLKGGHSGVQIHERLANALKLLTHALHGVRAGGLELTLASLTGGNARNAIPRDAVASVALPEGQFTALQEAVGRIEAGLRQEWGDAEPGLTLQAHPAAAPEEVLAGPVQDALLGLLHTLPHGILAWSKTFPGKVETSSNLAQVTAPGSAQDGALRITTSSRSFAAAELERVQAHIRATAEDAGAQVELQEGYPGWEPDPGSELLRVAREVYEEQFGQHAEVQVIHAGLECGVIAARVPGMQAISFGPRIEGAHTPEERVSVPTVASTWRLLTALLDRLSG